MKIENLTIKELGESDLKITFSFSMESTVSLRFSKENLVEVEKFFQNWKSWNPNKAEEIEFHKVRAILKVAGMFGAQLEEMNCDEGVVRIQLKFYDANYRQKFKDRGVEMVRL